MLAPEMQPGAEPFYRAWCELSSDRNDGGPIPFSALNVYAMRYGFSDIDEFDLLRRAVRAMDEIYLDFARQKIEAAGRDGRAANPPSHDQGSH